MIKIAALNSVFAKIEEFRIQHHPPYSISNQKSNEKAYATPRFAYQEEQSPDPNSNRERVKNNELHVVAFNITTLRIAKVKIAQGDCPFHDHDNIIPYHDEYNSEEHPRAVMVCLLGVIKRLYEVFVLAGDPVFNGCPALFEGCHH